MFILTPSIKAAIAAATFFEAQTASDLMAVAPNCDRTAYINPGDTCNIISARDSVSTFQLGYVNPWINPTCSNLPANEVICIGYQGQDCTNTYVVQSGDICQGIAGKYNIPVSTLLHNNPNVNQGCTNLQPSEVLCVSGTQYNYTTSLD